MVDYGSYRRRTSMLSTSHLGTLGVRSTTASCDYLLGIWCL